MTDIIVDPTGKIVARDPAGGQGGGVTSYATREPTTAELSAYHAEQVAISEAALESAKAADKAHAEVAKAEAAAAKEAEAKAAAEAKKEPAPGPASVMGGAGGPLPPVPHGVPLQPAPPFAPRPAGP